MGAGDVLSRGDVEGGRRLHRVLPFEVQAHISSLLADTCTIKESLKPKKVWPVQKKAPHEKPQHPKEPSTFGPNAP